MSLKDWAGRGWIEAHETSPEEIGNLLRIAQRDVAQSETPGLAPEWKLNIAYNAALQCATAALAACGFRPRDHYYAIESLRHTLGLPPGFITRLDAFRKRRNMNAYDRDGMTSDKEAVEMQDLARELLARVRKWLHEHHSKLLLDARRSTSEGL